MEVGSYGGGVLQQNERLLPNFQVCSPTDSGQSGQLLLCGTAEPLSVTRSTTTAAKKVAKSKEKVLCQILSPSPGSNLPFHQFSAKLAQLYLTFLYIYLYLY